MQLKRSENMLQSKINIFSFIFPSSIKPTQTLTKFDNSHLQLQFPLIIKYEW
jgi:hypothetical protein